MVSIFWQQGKRCQPLFLLLSLLLTNIFLPTTNAEFNYEVEKRVLERIDDYMNGPRIANGISAKFRTNGGFEHGMDARDRNAYLRFAYSLIQEFKFDLLYFGLEDGTFLGYGNGWGTYREPVNSGYEANDPSLQHYYQACVDRETGVDQTCTMQTGDMYIRCIRNCGLMKCADDETQTCSEAIGPGFDASTSSVEMSHCTKSHAIKWCRQYDIAEAQEEETLGFVPRTYHCHDERGAFTQQPGRAVRAGFLEDVTSPKLRLGDCEYENKLTKVERYEVGPYSYCNGGTCENTFDGGYRSRDYDPRYRGWYIQTKELQVPNWSPPYPFFSRLDLGITYSHPIYSDDPESGRHIFEGVMAVDYTFADIGKFLVNGYKDSNTMVVVYEEEQPNFIVASSSGRQAASKVLAENPDIPCPDVAGEDSSSICIVVRDSMKDLQGFPMDPLLVRAYKELKDKDYPRELLTVKGSGSDSENEDEGEQLYIVQSSFYRPGGDLNWIILVMSPAGEGTADALTKDNSLFGLVCVVASLGFCLCLVMFYFFYRQRHERAVILADWRFTSAFLLGCALLNLSSFTLLGENTDALCLTRMWSFHFLFALALSPLFVKVWRMWRMVGAANRRPTIVNHTTAAMFSLPIVAIQVLILIIFSFADPPKQEEIIDIEDGIVTQHIICSQDSNAFMIVTIIFEAGLVLTGCILAFVTRNLDSKFGEAKQLMFSMYNIAFIGIITTIIIYTMDIDATGQIVLRAIGVFWGTVFSSAAFVLPRLMQVKEEKKTHKSIMKKSQRGSGETNTANRGSKVRFSLDDDKSSVQSENPKSGIDTRSQATDKKSNIASRFNEHSKSGRDPDPLGEKQDNGLVMPTTSIVSASASGMADDSFFIKRTGWSENEHASASNLARRLNESGNDEFIEDQGGNCDAGGQDNTARSTSSEEEKIPTNNVGAITEGHATESSGDDAGEKMVASVDNC